MRYPNFKIWIFLKWNCIVWTGCLDIAWIFLQVHARNKMFSSEEEKEVLLQEIAELTDDFTGAELQNVL